MKHGSIDDQQEQWPARLETSALYSAPRQASDSEIEGLRLTVERQFRTNRTLLGLLELRTDPKAQSKRADMSPRISRAGWTTRPVRRVGPGKPEIWPHRAVTPATALVPAVGFECQSLNGSEAEAVVISVLGLTGKDLDSVVASVAREQQPGAMFRPVFLTDQTDVSAFTSRGFAFEYVRQQKPFSEEARGPESARSTHFYVRKWGASRIVNRDNARSLDRDYPPLALVAKHNAEMSRACHTDRFAWMAETLRIALASERYDAAGGLADYLLASFDRIAATTQIAVARGLCRKFVAFGEIEALRRFLFKNYTRLASDDNLFTLFSVYCTSEQEFVPALAKLPSGKLNSYYISKRSEPAGDHILPLYLGATESTAPNVNFLLANYFASRKDRDLYRMFVNRGLAKIVQTQLKKVSFDCSNVLGAMHFDHQTAAPHQHDLVSVIMSCHNSAETVHYAAKSILEQSYGRLELLICDDNPANDTLQALGALRGDARVRLFRSNVAQGTYNIRNNLIRQARGSLITFHDSDDLALPDRLEKQVAFLRERDVAAVYGQWYRVTRSGEFVFSSEHSVARISVVSLLGQRGVFEAAGPYRSASFGADTEFLENLRMRFGTNAVPNMQVPLIFGLSSEMSLTRRAGMEATEDGYRSAARRIYAAASARTRLISWETDQSDEIDRRLAEVDVSVPDAGVIEVTN
jgi:hypothetical protein